MTLKHLKELNLLYVEDDENIGTMMVKTLSMFVKDVIWVKNGIDGLEAYKSKPIHIIAMDYVMPFMDGVEFAREIRKIDRDIPILFMSNHSEKEKLLEVIKLNVVDYLEKPVQYQGLIESLTNMAEILGRSCALFVPINDAISYDKINKLLKDSGGEPISLTKNEVSFLELFLLNRGRLVSKEMISVHVYDHDMSEHQLKNLLTRIKKKIGHNTIINIKELGYILK